MPKPVIYIAAVLLVLGAAPLPYGYYQLLRIVATIVFVWAASVSFGREYTALPWVFALLAILFNPVVKIYLPKEMWSIIDIACGVFLAVSARHFSVDEPEKTDDLS